MSAAKKTDISLYIGIFSTSIIGWLFLYNYIVDISVSDSGNYIVIPLGFVHFGLTLCVFFSGTLLLYGCMEHAVDEKEFRQYLRLASISNLSKRILFKLWAPMILISIMVIIISEIFSSSMDSKWLTLTYAGSVVFCIIFFQFVFGINLWRYVLSTKYFYSAVILIPISSVQIFILAEATSKVTIKTDKEFYIIGEVVRFHIQKQGYIILPGIESVTYGPAKLIEDSHPYNYHLALLDSGKDLLNSSFINVTYANTVSGITKRKSFEIHKTQK